MSTPSSPQHTKSNDDPQSVSALQERFPKVSHSLPYVIYTLAKEFDVVLPVKISAPPPVPPVSLSDIQAPVDPLLTNAKALLLSLADNLREISGKKKKEDVEAYASESDELVFHSPIRSVSHSPFKKDISRMSQDEVLQHAETLRGELLQSQTLSHDVAALKAKTKQLVAQLRAEKANRLKENEEFSHHYNKIDILMDHIDRVMKQLRMLSAERHKALENYHAERKAHNASKKFIEELQRTVKIRSRCVAELREGSKILEGQLQLMDEKFHLLQSKMATIRSFQQNHVNKAKKEAQTLRTKYQIFAMSLPPEYLSAHAPPPGLDHVSLPKIEKLEDKEKENEKATGKDDSLEFGFNKGAVGGFGHIVLNKIVKDHKQGDIATNTNRGSGIDDNGHGHMRGGVSTKRPKSAAAGRDSKGSPPTGVSSGHRPQSATISYGRRMSTQERVEKKKKEERDGNIDRIIEKIYEKQQKEALKATGKKHWDDAKINKLLSQS